MTVIWHNPRCSKSRKTLELLRERGVEPEIRLYLQDPPSRAELEAVIAQMGGKARDLIRTGEKAYKEQALVEATDAALIAAMAETPVLIERPVVIHAGKVALGRPPVTVLSLLG